MASITAEIIREQLEFVEALKHAKVAQQKLQKDLEQAHTHEKKGGDQIKRVLDSVVKARENLKEILQTLAGQIDLSEKLAKEYDMAARKAKDVETYLNDLKKEEKVKEKYFRSATDKKVKLEAEAFEKALAKAQRDYNNVEATRDLYAEQAKKPLDYFEKFHKDDWAKHLTELTKSLASLAQVMDDVEKSARYF